MRIISIDYGRKRIGIAVCDALGITVNPVSVLTRVSLRTDIAALAKIVSEKEAEMIVVGMPQNMDGTPGILAPEVHDFADKLKEATGLSVEFCDERLTSREAQSVLREKTGLSRKRRKEAQDKIAACIILQNYLDRRNL